MAQEKTPPITVALTLAVTVVLALFIFSHTTLYKRFDHASDDFRWNYCARPDLADKDTVIISIDDYSIKNFSEKFNFNWPWPRQFYGIVIDYLKKAGASSVTLDMLFTQSEVGRMDVDGATSEQSFAEAMKKSGFVIVGENLSDEISQAKSSVQETQGLIFENSEKIPGKKFRSVEEPIDLIADAAARTGVVNFHADEDGVCRRLPLVFNVNGTLKPQLSFAAYLVSENDSIVRYDIKKHELVTRNKRFPLDRDGYYTVHWYGKGGPGGVYRYDAFYNVFVSATQTMSGENPSIPFSEFKGKNVVICATASGLMDLKATPFSTTDAPYPGGEIHATLFDNLKNGRAVKHVSDYWIRAVALTLMVLLAYVYISRSLASAVGLSVVLIVAPVVCSFYLLRNHMVQMNYIFPVLAVFFTSMVSAVYKTLTEGQKKRQIKAIFSRYLHEDVIDLLMQDPERVDLEGTELVATVLFTDLQGFTTFAEDKSPKTLIAVLNRYFETVTGIVLDLGGMLDKYTGDGIMAIFGAPLPKEGHARAACEAILAFRDKGVNDLISTEGVKILTRIGISSGPIVVGNLGSSRNMDFTAIGDTVNLSARLEGVNKAYGTTNIMSEYTWEFVKDDYYFRELDFIRVKGKNKPIRVFTLIDRLESMTGAALEIEQRFQLAMMAYRERKWDEAAALFGKVLELNPGDPPSEAYIERCELLKTHDDLVDEQGVFTFKTK